MTELLDLVNSHYDLNEESVKIFTTSMMSAMSSQLGSENVELITSTPVFFAMLLSQLQDAIEITHGESEEMSTFRFSVNINDDNPFGSTESYLSELAVIIVDGISGSISTKSFDRIEISNMRLSVSGRDINCDIRMVGY